VAILEDCLVLVLHKRSSSVPSTVREAVIPFLQQKESISVPLQLSFPLQKNPAMGGEIARSV
jgi:hypothetical protein